MQPVQRSRRDVPPRARPQDQREPHLHLELGPLFHHERQTGLSLGALPEDGEQRRELQPAAVDRQRLLQDGAVLVRRQSVRHAGQARPEPGVLGGEARSHRRSFPRGGGAEVSGGHAGRRAAAAEEQHVHAGRSDCQSDQAVGEGEEGGGAVKIKKDVIY